MDLGSNFSAKLEPFLLMAKSAKGAAAAKLIQDATSAPGVLVFSELLEMPNIQELAKSEQHSKFYSLLQLFAYKTYQDYVQHQSSLPPLNPAQITKLKYLTIVTLASHHRILPYTTLLTALSMPNIRELEDLIIDAIYQDILRGKLDQKHEQLEVEYTMGRDVESSRIEELLDALRRWGETSKEVLETLDGKIASIAADGASRKTIQAEYDRALQATLKEVHEKSKDAGKGSGGGGGRRNVFGDIGERMGMGSTHHGHEGKGGGRTVEAMDVDEPAVEQRKLRKVSQDSATKPLRKKNKF